VTRCWWCGNDPQYVRYHDLEWGMPVVDDQRLFEKLCLEGFKAGLSWLTILRKRDAFREVFADFDIATVAGFTETDVQRLLKDARIVRHRKKIEATINNAKRALELIDEAGSLTDFVWSFEPPSDARPSPVDLTALRTLTQTPESTRLSKALKKRGWRFVGPTTAYAFMQSMGIVNDHIEGCHARAIVEDARQRRRS